MLHPQGGEQLIVLFTHHTQGITQDDNNTVIHAFPWKLIYVIYTRGSSYHTRYTLKSILANLEFHLPQAIVLLPRTQMYLWP